MAANGDALRIRGLTDADHPAWLPLWHQYLGYHGVWPEDAPPETWPRLMHPDEPMHAIGAFLGARLVGFAHVVYHRHTWRSAYSCFLADMFTAPDARRLGVARALMESVYARAAERGADHLYGTTLLGNTTSQQLYDEMAERLNLVVYRHEL